MESCRVGRRGQRGDHTRRPVLTDDASILTKCDGVDVVLEVTGTVAPAARVVLQAFKNRKHVVLVNAELDSLLGPILKIKADQAGVVLTHTDGDEPGVAMTLLRYLRTLGLRPVAAGNIKGMVDYYRTPATQEAFAKKNDQDARKVTSFADATKLSMETTVLANATGFRVGRRGMHGPACGYVREVGGLLPAAEMLDGGLIDYALGAAPHTGAFVVIHEDSPLKKAQLAYYKLGDGPFYVFYTPFHLPHLQIALDNRPSGRPSRPDRRPDRRSGLRGGHGRQARSESGRTARRHWRILFVRPDRKHRAALAPRWALPIGLSEGCVLRHDVPKDGHIG